MGKGTLKEKIKFQAALPTQDIATDRTGPYMDPGLYTDIAAILNAKDVADTKVATVQILQATSLQGAGAKPLTAVVSKTAVEQDSPADGENLIVVAAARVEDIDHANGFKYVAVKATSDDTSIDANAVWALSGARYEPVDNDS